MKNKLELGFVLLGMLVIPCITTYVGGAVIGGFVGALVGGAVGGWICSRIAIKVGLYW